MSSLTQKIRKQILDSTGYELSDKATLNIENGIVEGIYRIAKLDAKKLTRVWKDVGLDDSLAQRYTAYYMDIISVFKNRVSKSGK